MWCDNRRSVKTPSQGTTGRRVLTSKPSSDGRVLLICSTTGALLQILRHPPLLEVTSVLLMLPLVTAVVSAGCPEQKLPPSGQGCMRSVTAAWALSCTLPLHEQNI